MENLYIYIYIYISTKVLFPQMCWLIQIINDIKRSHCSAGRAKFKLVNCWSDTGEHYGLFPMIHTLHLDVILTTLCRILGLSKHIFSSKFKS